VIKKSLSAGIFVCNSKNNCFFILSLLKYVKNYIFIYKVRGICVMKNEKLAINFFKQYPGVHRTRDILKAGVYNRTLYRLKDRGDIVRVGYGLYKLAGEYGARDVYSELGCRIPKGVFCLISALDFHEIGTEVPYNHWITLPFGAYKPVINEYSVNFCFSREPAYSSGIDKHIVSGTDIFVYNPAKTVVDCFKYRNKIGIGVAVEALKETLKSKKANIDGIIHYADICRMRNVIMSYLEAVQ